jgi:hypothetical protein
MRHHESKLERANVVAAFESQDNADEALLELRLAGFPDRKIGYYYPGAGNQMNDLLARYHRLAAAVIWGVAGAVIGWIVGVFLDRAQPGVPLDPVGLGSTLAFCGALFLGTAGGMVGLWTEAPGESVRVAGEATHDPFVMAVDAGDAREEVRAILHRRGGHEVHPQLAT